MVIVIDHDVQTGIVTEREETDAERLVREKDAAEYEARRSQFEQETAAAAAKRAAVIEALAAAAGLNVEEVKEALNV